MKAKPRRDHDADAAMLAYRTGLGAVLCKGWLESPVAKSAEATIFSHDRDDYFVDDNSINIIRSEIEAYALAQVKKEPARLFFRGPRADVMGLRSRRDIGVSRANLSF